MKLPGHRSRAARPSPADRAPTLPSPSDGEAPIEGALLRVLLIASVGSFLLNLSATTINVAIDRLMDRSAGAALRDAVDRHRVSAGADAGPAVVSLDRRAPRIAAAYVACLVGFSATSALCALAWSAPSLIAFRVLQGAVGGLLAPLTQALIAQLAGPKRMGRAVYGVSALGHAHGVLTPRVTLPLVVAVVLVTLFVVDARRRPASALLDLGLFRRRAVGAALATYLLASFASFGAQFVLPLYYQQVRGESPLHAGLLLAPQGLGMLLTLPQVGRLADRVDQGKIAIVGVLTTFLGTLAFTQVTEAHARIVLSASRSSCVAPGWARRRRPRWRRRTSIWTRDEVPNATTALNVVQRLGAPLGTAAMAVTLQRFLRARPARAVDTVRPVAHALARAFAHTFAVTVALSAPRS